MTRGWSDMRQLRVLGGHDGASVPSALVRPELGLHKSGAESVIPSFLMALFDLTFNRRKIGFVEPVDKLFETLSLPPFSELAFCLVVIDLS